MSHFFTDEQEDGSPLIVQLVQEFADVITAVEVKRWSQKHMLQAPWLANSVLNLLHGLVTGFGKISQDVTHAVNVDDDTPRPFIMHEELLNDFQGIKISLMDGIKQSSLGHFESPSSSYAFFLVYLPIIVMIRNEIMTR